MKNEVLVISDDFSTCKNVYESFFEMKGFNVCFTADFNDAIKEIKNDKKYLIIIDMDNPTVKKRDLRHIKPFIEKGINKIILVVKDISDDALNECLEILQINVIKKPFEIEDFLIDVEVLLKT